MHSFKIGEMDLLSSDKYKPVFLDDKEIFRLDFSTYMGHRRPQEKELCEVLSKHLGYTVTENMLNRAMMFECFPDNEPEE